MKFDLYIEHFRYGALLMFFEKMENSDLSSTERHFIMSLTFSIDKNGSCTLPYSVLMKQTRLSNPTVTKCIKSLSKKGWLRYSKGLNSQEPNTYTLNLAKIDLDAMPYVLMDKGVDITVMPR